MLTKRIQRILESPRQAIYKPHNSAWGNLSAILSRHTFLATSDISKKKLNLTVDEYDGETLSNDKTKNIRKLLKGSNFVS